MTMTSSNMVHNCRAVLLLQKELAKLKKAKIWGVEVIVDEHDIFTWNVKLTGLKDTIWQESELWIVMKFSEAYNYRPPHVAFTTIPIHPNVDSEDGSVCLDCLSEWTKSYSVMTLILSLQCMLSEPSLNDPFNMHAARLHATSPNHYRQIVQDFILHQKLLLTRSGSRQSMPNDSASPIAESLRSGKLIPSPPTVTGVVDGRNITSNKNTSRYKLSYEDYLNQWKSIGTTHPCASKTNPQPQLVPDHSSASPQTCAQPEQLFSLKGGKVDQLKATRLQLLKDIRGNKKGGKDLSISLNTPPETVNRKNIDEYLDAATTEVNSLISWTETLPAVNSN